MEIDEPDVMDPVVEEEEDAVLAAALEHAAIESLFEEPQPQPAAAAAAAVYEDIQTTRPLILFCCIQDKRTGFCDGKIDSPAMTLFTNYCIHHGSKSTIVLNELAVLILYLKFKFKDDAYVCKQVVDDRFDQDVYNDLCKRMEQQDKQSEDAWFVLVQDKQGKLRAWSGGKCHAYLVLEALVNVGFDSQPALKKHAMALAKMRCKENTQGTILANAVQKMITELFDAVEKEHKMRV